MSRRESQIQLVVFCFVLLVHFQSPVETPFDSGWSIHVASSLVQEGDVDLDEFAPRASADDYRILEVDGRLLPRYPVAPSIMVLPAFVATKSVCKAIVGFSLDRHYVNGGSTAGMERWLSSLLVAWCAVLVYRLARRQLNVPRALLVTGVFAFATSAWSVVSRALWQHSPSMVCGALALLALDADDRPGRPVLAGLAVAASYTMRPTNVLPVVAVTSLFVWRRRPQLAGYLAGAALVSVPFVVANLSTWRAPLPPYFLLSDSGMGLEGLAGGLVGTLLSPGRGLFVYSPVLLFCFVGLWLRWRRPGDRDLALTLAAVCFGHWLMVSAWFAWWGGEVYGPRLFADLLPFAMYFLIPAVGAWRLRAAPARALATAALFAATLVWSVWIHHRGATEWAAWDWNRMPVSVESKPERLWDWRHPPFFHDESLDVPGRR